MIFHNFVFYLMIELTEYRFINISLTSSNDAVGGGYRLMKYMK
jgi:hypothetical protein